MVPNPTLLDLQGPGVCWAGYPPIAKKEKRKASKTLYVVECQENYEKKLELSYSLIWKILWRILHTLKNLWRNICNKAWKNLRRNLWWSSCKKIYRNILDSKFLKHPLIVSHINLKNLLIYSLFLISEKNIKIVPERILVEYNEEPGKLLEEPEGNWQEYLKKLPRKMCMIYRKKNCLEEIVAEEMFLDESFKKCTEHFLEVLLEYYLKKYNEVSMKTCLRSS